jgi:hypothetical protein
MNDLIVSKGGSTLPTARPQETLEKAVDSALAAAEKGYPLEWPNDPAAKLAAVRAFVDRVEALDLQDLAHRLDAAMKPSTVKEVGVLLARLVAGYPTKNRDPEFGTILFEEVAATEPSFGALDRTVRQLLRNSEFLPSIAEVIEALCEAKWHLEDRRRKLAGKQQSLETVRALVKYLERTPEEIERDNQAAQEREINQCVELLMGGCEVDYDRLRSRDGTWLRLTSAKFTGKRGAGGFYKTDIIEEARRRVLDRVEVEGWDDFTRDLLLGPTEAELG